MSWIHWSYYYLKQYEKDNEIIERMIELDPDNFELYVRLTDNYVRLKQYDKCIDRVEPVMYNKANGFIRESDLSYTYLNVAVCYSKKNNFRKAEEINRQALEIHDSASGHNNLGVSLAEQGRKTEAIAEYKKALEIDSNYIGARNNLRHLDK